MNSKDKACLEKFKKVKELKGKIKKSSNLIGLKNFEATGFSIIAALGWYSPISQKVTKSPPIIVPPPNF